MIIAYKKIIKLDFISNIILKPLFLSITFIQRFLIKDFISTIIPETRNSMDKIKVF